MLFFPKDSVEALLVQMMDKVFYHSHFLVSEWNELRGQYLWLGRWSSGIGKSEADGLSTRFLVIKRFVFIDPSQIMLMCFFNNYWIGPLLSFPGFKFWGFIWLFHGFLTLHYLPASSLQVDSTLDPCVGHWDKSSWIEPGPLKVLCEVVFLSASGFLLVAKSHALLHLSVHSSSGKVEMWKVFSLLRKLSGFVAPVESVLTLHTLFYALGCRHW